MAVTLPSRCFAGTHLGSNRDSRPRSVVASFSLATRNQAANFVASVPWRGRALRDRGSPGGELNSYRLIIREAGAGFGAAGGLQTRPLTSIFVNRCLPALTPVFHRFAHDRARNSSAGDEAGEAVDFVPACAISAHGRSHRDIMTS